MKPGSKKKKTVTGLIIAGVILITACAAAFIAGSDFIMFFSFPYSQNKPETPESALAGQPPDLPEEIKVKITMAGDFMLHSPLNRAAKTGGNSYDYTQFLSEIRPYVDGDLNITDIEGPVDSFGGNKNISSYPNFNYPLELLDGIKFAGFNFVVTANNHAYDKGWEGLLAMRDKLSSKGLSFLGTYASEEEYATPYIKEINGVKIGISAWSALDNGISFMVKGHEGYAMKKFNQDKLTDLPRMLDDIAKLRAAGAEIVLMPLHWGAEYQDNPTPTQKEIAKKLAEGGADVIIGGHPHCVQPIEVYENGGKKSIVIYSLGNFFADQIGLSPPIPKTQYGMLASVEFTRDGFGNIFVSSANYMPTFCYRDPALPKTGTGSGYILAPAGKYAETSTRPSGFSEKLWDVSKKSWEHARRVAGGAIPAYGGK
jgi:poly-gamma-glutamate synthesis protein (capsule biosynthesis protein)